MNSNYKYKVTAIIPAHNEENHILSVLNAVKKSKYIDEIVCVNDGSTDKTLDLIQSIDGIKIINLKNNHGKGNAIAKGIKKASGEIVVFFDADIVGLNENCISKLITPLQNNKYDGVIAYPVYNQFDHLFKPLSGERAYFKKDLNPQLKILEEKGYGLELYLNYIFKNKRIKTLPLKGVRHMLKHEKQNYDTVAKLLIIETIDLLSEIATQKNPIPHLIKYYFYPFYSSNQKKNFKYISKLMRQIKKTLLTEL